MKELLMCGKNTVIEAYNNNIKFKKIYLSKKENLNYFKNSKINIEIKDLNFLDTLTNENHQGFIGIVNGIQYQDINFLLKNKPENILILDHIQDPHNLGAIIRTANAAGINNIILPKEKCADINSTVFKVSSGGTINMNFYKVNSLSATITKLKKENYWVYATVLNEKSVSHTNIQYNKPTAIVLGSEGDGVSKSVLSVCDEFVYIKQKGTVQSLNVSVATGIILFDLINKNDKN
ncbi:23S rRNA (guanosine(2251)-2'-O)-methyltransferase RlmB [Mycoplasmopsis felis]|uniref:23S rRNA (guanosine(2251)-2'-O)-methyltransferase RlmB n=1 Tax=Mycoplasmopsis felis TaxID=33923 RepID=UPI002AFFDCC0|nr:23S rRNA (guanosine(2251)-2'-O)-methyltransferase RlmB [Mycoplasmopsis felis]WQQ04584.1 23S rRNA (guanosine(2251)-2'-O)-methyltransferase RlmB [Mycoplasmopsis felis]